MTLCAFYGSFCTSTCTGFTDITLTTPYQGYYCPNTTAILTCSASNASLLHWKANGQDIASVSSLGRVSTINNDAYTVNFITNTREYLTSTLQVAVDKIDAVTNISCLTRNNRKYQLIIKECKQCMIVVNLSEPLQ